MKKTILIFINALICLGISAATPGYMTFVTDTGDQMSISVRDLSITFSEGKLIARSADGQLTIPAISLTTMRFTDTAATGAADTITTEGEGSLEVFTCDGIRIGMFDSWQDMTSHLKAGTYIVNHNGSTVKIAL